MLPVPTPEGRAASQTPLLHDASIRSWPTPTTVIRVREQEVLENSDLQDKYSLTGTLTCTKGKIWKVTAKLPPEAGQAGAEPALLVPYCSHSSLQQTQCLW